MFKKSLSVLFAVLMILSIIPFATAETEYNYTVKTEFYGYDEAAGEWVPVTTTSGGESLKMRVSVSTNYVSGPANFMLAYDKSVLSADLPSNGSSAQLTTNPDKKSFAYTNIQMARGANGVNAANQQLGYGNITQDELDKYSFIVGSVITNGCIQYDGTDWLFEVDMTVTKGSKGKSFDCIILPGTVQSVTNKKGMVNFPYAPAVSSDLTTVTAASNWYEGTPVVQASEISVIANTLVPEYYDVTFYANGGTFADGTDTLVKSVEAYEAFPETEAPARTGYAFAGWEEEIPTAMPAESLTFTARWQANSYTASFDANGGAFTDGNETKTADFDYDSDIIFSDAPVMQGYVFAGWSENKNGEAADNLGKMDEQGRNFYACWIAAEDVAYIAETYMMQPDGAYSLTETAYEGTTGETVELSYTVPEGFELNEEKSVLNGTVSADGSLVLKAYYDRRIYKFTTVVNGVQTATEYRYGAEIAKPATPVIQGYTFKGWSDEVPATMPATDVTLTAGFEVSARVKIKNNPGTKTINYGETLRLTAEASDMPEGAYVKWSIEGSGVSMAQNADGSVCELKSTSSGTVTVTAAVVDKNGNPLSNASGKISDSQKVISNAGIWQKIVSFFKNLFGANRTIIQMFRIWG